RQKHVEEKVLLEEQIGARMSHVLAPARLLERIREAIQIPDAGLSVLGSALRHIRLQLESESERIDQDIAAAAEALREADDHLRVVARETMRPRIFGVDRALNQFIRELKSTSQKITNENTALSYLPLLRLCLPELERSVSNQIEWMEDRTRTIHRVDQSLRT